MVGGARGWHHAAKVSMITMVPPQQGQRGRGSEVSAVGGSSVVGATPSMSRAWARQSLRAELSSEVKN